MPVVCTLTREQATLYRAAVEEAFTKLKRKEGIERKGLILALLTSLKQICNHPAHYLDQKRPLAGRSGKLARLTEMLQETVAAGDPALVFTQAREMGDRLVAHLSATLGGEMLYLHGGVARAARDAMVRRFQEEPRAPSIFVLSLRAGGTGLNLTRATRVFHFDRWWNPAVEDQATDRTHRIGQDQVVQVYRLLAAGLSRRRSIGCWRTSASSPRPSSVRPRRGSPSCRTPSCAASSSCPATRPSPRAPTDGARRPAALPTPEPAEAGAARARCARAGGRRHLVGRALGGRPLALRTRLRRPPGPRAELRPGRSRPRPEGPRWGGDRLGDRHRPLHRATRPAATRRPRLGAGDPGHGRQGPLRRPAPRRRDAPSHRGGIHGRAGHPVSSAGGRSPHGV